MFCVSYSFLVALVLQQAVDGTSWPKGKYALLKPTTGCPDGWLGEGWLLQDTENTNPSNNRSRVLNFDGYVTPIYVIRSFCVKTGGDQASNVNWPNGSYCIYRKRNESLLFGMTAGLIKMKDESLNNKDTAKYLAYNDWIYFSLSGKKKDSTSQHNHLVLYLQCKTNGSIKVPIELPITQPFYLLPYGSRDCQQVKWMVATTEWIKYHTRDYQGQHDTSGAIPYFELGDRNHTGITMYYCYYESCNYTLTEKRGLFKSPGFPDEYPDGQLCSWRIMVPANHTVHVHFTNFSLFGNDEKDNLTFYRNVSGVFQLNNTFHGNRDPFTLNATNDVLFEFMTNEKDNNNGFRAEYTIYLSEETIPQPTPTTNTAVPTEKKSSSSSTAKGPSNNRTAFAHKAECEKIGTTVVIVIPLVCLIIIITIVIVVYRCRYNQQKKPQKREILEERVDDMINPIYEQGDIMLDQQASRTTVTITTDLNGGQKYATPSPDQNTTTMNKDYNDEKMYQTLSRDQQPYESPDYSKQNRTAEPNMDPGYPEYHELEPMGNNVPDVVYVEGPDLNKETTHNPLYESATPATMATRNQLYDSLA